MIIGFFYRLVTLAVGYLLMPLYASIEARGVQNIPRRGPVILVSNHLNDADPGIMATRIPRRLVFMTKVELFRIPVLSRFLRMYGAFPVRRQQADLAALRRSNETLKSGLALVLFPEGTRSGKRASLGEAWPGAALIALRNRVPIVPVAITGSQDMALPWLFLSIPRRRRVTLTVGEPFFLIQPARIDAAAVRDGTTQIMATIAALLPEPYRGYYGSDRERPAEVAPAGDEEQP